jgi:hypothetical protein
MGCYYSIELIYGALISPRNLFKISHPISRSENNFRNQMLPKALREPVDFSRVRNADREVLATYRKLSLLPGKFS